MFFPTLKQKILGFRSLLQKKTVTVLAQTAPLTRND